MHSTGDGLVQGPVSPGLQTLPFNHEHTTFYAAMSDDGRRATREFSSFFPGQKCALNAYYFIAQHVMFSSPFTVPQQGTGLCHDDHENDNENEDEDCVC